MTIVGVSGYARAGKDTIGEILCNEHGFTRVAFADKLKQIAYAVNPIVGVWPLTPNEASGASINGHLSQSDTWVGTLIADEATPSFMHLADVVDAFGWEVAKEIAEVRQFLQRLGTEGGRRVIGENFWVDLALRDLDPSGRYVVTDCRFRNEAAAIKELGGEMWRVERPGVGPANDHPSEVDLKDWDFDRIISNGGTLEDLAASVAHTLGVPA